MVLQHEDRTVGFQTGDGPRALEALLGNDLVLERRIYPEFRWGPGAARFVLGLGGQGAVSAAVEDEDIIGELRKVHDAVLQRKKNLVLERHGRLPVRVEPTRFDSWVLDRTIDAGVLDWLLSRSVLLQIWMRSDFGLYAQAVWRSDSVGFDCIRERASTIQVSIVEVTSERELPVW